MDFKIWDIVRLTEDKILELCRWPLRLSEELILGVEVVDVENWWLYYKDYDGRFLAIWSSHVELVPEDLHFKYGEIVEVYSHADKLWEKRIFISKIPWNVWSPYACVNILTEDDYRKWKTFDVTLWENIRKLKNQLTRKEIAEKFEVNEDFTLVD